MWNSSPSVHRKDRGRVNIGGPAEAPATGGENGVEVVATYGVHIRGRCRGGLVLDPFRGTRLGVTPQSGVGLSCQQSWHRAPPSTRGQSTDLRDHDTPTNSGLAGSRPYGLLSLTRVCGAVRCLVVGEGQLPIEAAPV